MAGMKSKKKAMLKNEDSITAAEKLVSAGYEDVVILEDYSYDSALVGVSEDGRAIYDYDITLHMQVIKGPIIIHTSVYESDED